MKLFDVDTNRDASTYVMENIETLRVIAQRWGMQEASADDLVADVYMALVKRENNGNPYRSDGSEHVEMINAKGYVLSMMKAYAKNSRYWDGDSREVLVGPVSDTDEDTMTAVERQYMYATAGDFDEMSMVDESLVNMRDEIEFVINFTNSINIRALLENWNQIAQMAVSKSVMAPLKKIVKNNDEFAESLLRVIEFLKTRPDEFNAIMATI